LWTLGFLWEIVANGSDLLDARTPDDGTAAIAKIVEELGPPFEKAEQKLDIIEREFIQHLPK
jgi:hypothetical protein